MKDKLKLIIEKHLNHVREQVKINPERYAYVLNVLEELQQVINEDSLPDNDSNRSL